MYPYYIGTVNEKAVGPMRSSKVKADFEKLYGLAPTVVLMQEMWLARYRKILRSVFVMFQFFTPTEPKRESTIIAVARRSRDGAKLDLGKVWTALAHISIPGVSDRRVITCGIIYDALRKVKFTAMSFHPTPGAWNPGWRPLKALRRRRWKNAVAHLLTAVEHQLAQGRPVVIGMDANATLPIFREYFGAKVMGVEVKYVANGIDILAFIGTDEWEWYLDRDERLTVGTNSDHDALFIPAGLRRRK